MGTLARTGASPLWSILYFLPMAGLIAFVAWTAWLARKSRGEEEVEPDWSVVKPQVLEQIIREAEVYLKAQWDSHVATTQRALSIASIFVTIATAAAGFAIAALKDDPNDARMIYAAPVFVGTMVVAAAIALWAALPKGFHAPGNQPSSWYDCLDVSINEARAVEAQNYQAHIESNRGILERRANAVYWSVSLAIIALIVGGTLWLAVNAIV